MVDAAHRPSEPTKWAAAARKPCPSDLPSANRLTEILPPVESPAFEECGSTGGPGEFAANPSGFVSAVLPVRPSTNPSTLPQILSGRPIQSNRMVL
jgi:hypothetical protein